MQVEQIYDVAVIGGGLAGLCVAIQCAQQNLSVVLFEKEAYPFHKVCGEYISLESWNFLKRLGVQLNELDLPIIKKLQLSNVAGKMYGFDLPLGGFGISRFTLDANLYKLAELSGVVVFSETKVDEVDFFVDLFTLSSKNVTVKSKIAIGSYGKRSNLDIKWKRPFAIQKPTALNNYIGIKYHVSYQHLPGEIALHNFYNGYCGLSKIEDGKSCLCYLTTADNLRKSGNSITEMEHQILFKNPRLKEIFHAAQFLYDQPLAISQISFSKKKQVENHVLMLGDAAGLISPLCGNGMSMAMHSSKLAFIAIKQFLQGKLSRQQMEAEYAANWQKEFSQRLFIGRTVQRFFGGDIATSLFLKTMSAFPFLAKRVITATHGKPF